VKPDETLTGLGGIVLAAGAPANLHTCPGLVLFRGEPLARRAARVAVEAGLWPVVVVVGDRADGMRAALAGLPVVTADGATWGGGLKGALLLGLHRLEECAPTARGAAVLACDPPAIEAAHLHALARSSCGKHPAAAFFEGRLRLPALFPAAFFKALGAKGGDAEALLLQISEEVAPVALHFTEGSQ
jgi:molybdenum cofactor cytidylyltransferase